MNAHRNLNTRFPLCRSAVLRGSRIRELRQQFHGAGRRTEPVSLGQLSVCAEHPQADAGEGDRPQCVPAGHVQEEVRRRLIPASLLHLKLYS